MSEQENNGSQVATAPESAPVQSEADKKFYEMNPHLGKSETTQTMEQKPSEGVKEDKPKQETANPDNGQTERHDKSGWERSLKRTTRQRNEAREEAAELRRRLEKYESANNQPIEPKKFSRESFKSDEEYWNYLAENKAKEIVSQQLAEREKQTNESLEEIQARTRFEKEWYNKAKEALGSDEATKQYLDLVKESHATGLAEEIPQDVYAFLENSEIGALLHSILLTKDDIRNRIVNAHESYRPFELYDLQSRIIAGRQNVQEPQKKVTQAPAPVGNPTVSGSAVDEKQLPWKEQLEIYAAQKKKF